MDNQYLNNFFSLKNKTAVIIGAGGHLCSEMARGLAKSGCSLSLLDIRLEKVKKIKEELLNEGHKNLICEKIDVQNKDDHIMALEKTVNTLGNVDILINGAGINSASSFFDITVDDWNSVLSSQLLGTFLGCQAFGDHTLKNKYGSIFRK